MFEFEVNNFYLVYFLSLVSLGINLYFLNDVPRHWRDQRMSPLDSSLFCSPAKAGVYKIIKNFKTNVRFSTD